MTFHFYRFFNDISFLPIKRKKNLTLLIISLITNFWLTMKELSANTCHLRLPRPTQISHLQANNQVVYSEKRKRGEGGGEEGEIKSSILKKDLSLCII